MAHSIEPREGEFEVTPAEDRFLRAFFHRHAGRYLAGVGAAAVLGVVAALSVGSGGADPAALEEARSGIDALRAENEQLRGELEALAQGAAAPAQQLGALEQRLTGALRRLEKVEASLEKASQRTGSVMPPDSATSWDVSAILDRLYNLEVRQEAEERAREALARRVVRMSSGSSSGSAAPRAPAPVAPAAPQP